MTDNALKTISITDDELRVGNYIVLFGGRDLEGLASDRVNGDGSRGEFFTSETALESPYTKTGRLLVDWEHGQSTDDGLNGDDVLGFVDWSTAKADITGVWVERVLRRSARYMEFIETLIAEGLVGNSSEAIATGVEIGETGHLRSWPLRRDTLTVTPMEPRMITENAVCALKALGLLPEPEAKPEAQPGGDAGTALDAGNDTTKHTEATMPPEETKQAPTIDVEAVAQAAAEAAVKAYIASQPKPPPEDRSGFVITGGTPTGGHNNAEDKPWKSASEFFGALIHNLSDPRLRKLKSADVADEGGYSLAGAIGARNVGNLEGARNKAARRKAASGMNELVPADGGFLVGTDQGPSIVERVYNTGSILQRVGSLPISGNSNSMTVYGVDETSRANGSRAGGIQAYWAAEADEKTSSKPKFCEIDLKLQKLIGLVHLTDELLQDTTALGSWVMSKLPQELRFEVEDAIINGTGAGMPLGILNAGNGSLLSVAAESGQAATTLVAENIIQQHARRWGGGREYVYLHNQDIEPQLHTLSLTTGAGGHLVYMPPGGLSNAQHGRLYGHDVIPTEYNPTLGTAGDLLLADLSQYQLIEKGGIQSASSIHVRFVYDEQTLRFVWRIDGAPLWKAALTPYQGTNTQSPFVAIATRA